MNYEALWLTAKLSLIVAVLLMFIAAPIAYWVAYSRARWKFLVESVVAMPLVLPPTVLGFYMLVAMGTRSPIGRAYESWTGHTLAFTFEGLVIASLFYSLPFAVQPMITAFTSVDRALLDASSVLGASRWHTFSRVVVPLSWGGIIAAFVLSFAHTVGEFGVVLMVGGNIPGVTRTVSIDVYDRVQELDYTGANGTALFLLAFSFVTLAIVYAINRRLAIGVSR